MYCCRRRKRFRRRVDKRVLALVLVFVFALSAHLYFRRVVNPLIATLAETEVKQIANYAANTAVSEVLTENVDYLDLTRVIYDSQGRIMLLQTDTVKANLVAQKTIAALMRILGVESERGIGIPLTTMLGIPIISGRGPDINIRLRPASANSYKFYSEFNTSGINQTNHRIYLVINTEIKAALPLKDTAFNNVTQVLIAENIIVGEVPDFLFPIGSLDL